MAREIVTLSPNTTFNKIVILSDNEESIRWLYKRQDAS